MSPESERAVLAAVLLAPPLLAGVRGRIRSEHFFEDRHRWVYEAMLAIGQDPEREIDLRSLQAELEDRGRFDEVGGLAFLASLDADLPDLTRVDQYADTLLDRWARREICGLAYHLLDQAVVGGASTEELLERIQRARLAIDRERSLGAGFRPPSQLMLEATPPDEPTELVGLSTSLRSLDHYLHGLEEGQLILLAGRPGQGKTALALALALDVADRQGGSIGFASLEMSDTELGRRLISMKSWIPHTRVKTGRLTGEEWRRVADAQARIASLPFFWDDSPQTIESLAAKGRRLLEEQALSLLVVDYLQLLHSSRSFENRNLEVGAMSRSLKLLAKEWRIPILVLSQLSRDVEKRASKRPLLADLRDSGSLEQDADVVLFVYRAHMYRPKDESLRGKAEVIVAKNRGGEAGLSVSVAFVEELMLFRDLQTEEEEEA